MTEYRTDPETGKRYAFGGLIGNRTIDDRRSERDAFDALLERRAGELPQKRRSWRQRDSIERSLGWRADDQGNQICDECQFANRPGSDYCQNCGNPLNPSVGYDGAQDGDTIKCDQCGRMNPPSAKFCSGCGYALPLSTASASARPRRALTPERPAPVVFTRPAAHAHDGIRSNGMVVARESFIAIDPRTHQQVNVIAGRTRVGDGSWLHKIRPSAFQYAA